MGTSRSEASPGANGLVRSSSDARVLRRHERERQQLERIVVRQMEIVEEQDQRIAAPAQPFEEEPERGEETPPLLGASRPGFAA